MGTRKERSAINTISVLVHKTIQESWEEKKLAGALFMDVKDAFNHVSRSQLLRQMIELGIDGNLVVWTRSFLTDRKIQIIIDGYENKEKEIEAGIPQGSPALPIFFLIYISGVFDSVLESCSLIRALSFVDDLGFIASGSLVKDIALTLEKIAKTVLQ